jgi:hypothetical protein
MQANLRESSRVDAGRHEMRGKTPVSGLADLRVVPGRIEWYKIPD